SRIRPLGHGISVGRPEPASVSPTTCPARRFASVDKRSVVHPTLLRTPLPTPRIGRVENGEAFSTRYVQAASLTLRNRVRTKIGQHVRHVVRLAQLDPFLTQYRISGHHVKIELRQRPVTGVLLRGQVENHPVCQLVGDWLIQRLFLLVWRLWHRDRDAAFYAAGGGIAFLVEGFYLVARLRPTLTFLPFGPAFGFPDFVSLFADTLLIAHVVHLAMWIKPVPVACNGAS